MQLIRVITSKPEDWSKFCELEAYCHFEEEEWRQ